ncbi:hypothetical protein Dimus_019586 [Dionaea muscipula]
MESDPARIDIAGEDDSLLQVAPGSIGDELSNFACSPLQILGSRPPRVPRPPRIPHPPKTEVRCADAHRKSASSPHNNKENLKANTIKSGNPNLSVERQQMKKRRKGGGYNLRKSLAWNKAFLTEEGVLDPVELSMVSGISSTLDKEELFAICEHEKELLPTDSSSVNGVTDLLLLEENLFKELPCGRRNDNERIKGSLSQNKDLSSGNLASVSPECHTRRVFPAQTVKECGPKGGRLSSSASTSHKRLLNANTPKVAARDSKMPKMPALKQDSCVPYMAARVAPTRGRESNMKCSRIPKPGTSNQKSVNHSRTRSSPTVAITSPECSSKSRKTYSQSTTKIVDASRREVNSLVKHPTACVNKGNCLEVRKDGSHLSSEMDATKAPNGTRKFGVSLHSAACEAGSSALPVQESKASGLRMPSPSLRFFSETKAPASKSLLERNIQSSSLPKTVGASSNKKHLKPPYASGGSSRWAEDCITWNSSAISELTCKSSDSSDTKLHEKASRCENIQGVKTKVLSNAMDPEQMNNEQIQVLLNDLEQKCLKGQLISLQDEHTYGMDYRLASPHLQSTVEHHKPFDELPRLQDHHGPARENYIARHETCPTAMKEHAGDGETGSQVRNSHEDGASLKLDEKAHVINLSSDRKSGEDMCGPRATEAIESGIVAGDKSDAGTANDPVHYLSSRCYDASCKVVRKHSRQLGIGCLDFDNGYDNSIIHGELETRNDEGTEELPEPVVPIEENSSWQARSDAFSQENKFSGNSQKDHLENSSEIFLEVNTIDGARSQLSGDPSAPDEIGYVHFQSVRYDTGERQVWSALANGISEICYHNLNHSTDHDECLQVANSSQEQQEEQLQNGSHLMDNVIHFGHGNDVNGDILLSENCPSERIHKRNAFEILVNADEAHEAHVLDETQSSCSEADHQDWPATTQPIDGIELNHKSIHINFPLSGIKSNHRATNSSAHCYTGLSCSPNRRLSPLNTAVEQHAIVNEVGAQGLPTEAEWTASQYAIPNGDSARQLKGVICTEERNDEMRLQTSEDEKKQGGIVLKAPPNAVPFSDEWLAAIEAAGEEILTLKSGPVQNSPPDKPFPEPGPWSPVKRKTNQVIGPYDCTKFTNTLH